MPATYSIQVGTIIEAFRKPDIFNVLQDLPNNTQKLIKPKDVRDAFLSAWANSAFKVTTPSLFSNFEYIGLDSGDPNNRDIKNKILLGKRSYGNLDILNSTLLNSSTDIFIYNTKPDSDDQNSTKISILAGTNTSLFTSAPYIESYSTASSVNLNINNPSPGDGSINILSTTGRVSINGIVFPTVANTQATVSNGRVLKYSGTYPNGTLFWDDPFLTLTDIGTSTSVTNLYGSPSVYVNGYPLEFIEDSLVPVTVGGVTQGSSFSVNSFNGQNWPLSEVIREILYPELAPQLELSIENLATGTIYAEVNTQSEFKLDYTITTYSRETDEDISDIIIKQGANNVLLNVSGISFIGNPGSSTQSSLNYSITSNSISTYEFNLGVLNQPFQPILQAGFPLNYTTLSKSVEFILPSFSGFSPIIATISPTSTLQSVTNACTKLIKPNPGSGGSFLIPSSGTGYFYFIFPNSFANPIMIKDPNGYIIYDSNNTNYSNFINYTVSHPGYNNSPYKVWRTNYITSWSGQGQFEFIF